MQKLKNCKWFLKAIADENNIGLQIDTRGSMFGFFFADKNANKL